MAGLRVAFIPTYVSGVIFYRVWQPFLAMRRLFKKDRFTVTWYTPDQFEMHPWEAEVYDPEKFPYFYSHLDAAVRWADVVVWMGLHTPKALEFFMHFKAKYRKPFVTELDDFIFSIPTENAAFRSYMPGTDVVQIAAAQIKNSDGLIVSTPHLKDKYAAFNRNIHVVENAVNTSLWRDPAPPTRRKRQGVTIGWMGGGTHNADHESILPAVLEVLEKKPNLIFNYVSGSAGPKGYMNHPRIRFQHEYRDIKTYPKWILRKGFDIGIAPLIDNEFNRGKSNLRWLEYSAMGIPTVASPVTHFKQSIEHGRNGFLAGTHDEWVEHLTKLVDEPALRENIGRTARSDVEKNWSPEVMARTYREALGRLANAVPNTFHAGNSHQFPGR